jgi:hypothetical protein
VSENPDPLDELADSDWWQQAERRAQRDLRRSRRRARLRRASRWLPHTVAALALLLAGGGWFVQKGHLPDMQWPGWSESTADLADAEPAQDEPTTLLPEELAGDPFTGTPAAKYRPDADGIVLPAAKPLGKHSAAAVAAALSATKRLLVLSRLDHRALIRRDARPFLSALSPGYRAKADATGEVSSLAPGQSLLAPPRVSGTMTPALGKHGEITVVTKYVFVYALRPAWPVEDRLSTHVVVHADTTFSFVAGPRFDKADRGVWVTARKEYWSNISCAESDKGLLALPRPTDTQNLDGSGEDTWDDHRRAYQPGGDMSHVNTCKKPRGG